MNTTFNPIALEPLFELELDTPDLVQILADDYVENSSKFVEQISTAATKADFGTLELASHSLKSSSKVLGMDLLAETCLEIELAAHGKKLAPDAIQRVAEQREKGIEALQGYLKSRRATLA